MITKTFHLKHNDDDACSQGSMVPCKHEVAQLPSINTTKHTFNVEVMRCARLCSSLSYSSGKWQAHSPTFVFRCRSFLSFGCRFSLLSIKTPSSSGRQSLEHRVERRPGEEWRNLCRCAPKTRPGELTALWQPTPVDREEREMRHFWRYSTTCPQSAVAICFLSSSHEALRVFQRDKRPSW